VITEPNRIAETMVWPVYHWTVGAPLRLDIADSCGQHDVAFAFSPSLREAAGGVGGGGLSASPSANEVAKHPRPSPPRAARAEGGRRKA